MVTTVKTNDCTVVKPATAAMPATAVTQESAGTPARAVIPATAVTQESAGTPATARATKGTPATAFKHAESGEPTRQGLQQQHRQCSAPAVALAQQQQGTSSAGTSATAGTPATAPTAPQQWHWPSNIREPARQGLQQQQGL
jgi:hypothetical protein